MNRRTFFGAIPATFLAVKAKLLGRESEPVFVPSCWPDPQTFAATMNGLTRTEVSGGSQVWTYSNPTSGTPTTYTLWQG